MTHPSNASEPATYLQRGLWQIPTPNLRGVAARWNEQAVALRFVYAEPPSDIEIDLAKLAVTVTISELPPDNDLDVEDVVHVPMSLAVEQSRINGCPDPLVDLIEQGGCLWLKDT